MRARAAEMPGAEAGRRGAGAGARVEQVGDGDQRHEHVRFDGAQDRQAARRRGLVSASWTNASPSCWARLRVSPAGRSACTIDSSAAWTFSPPTGVEVAAEAHGCRRRAGGDGQRAPLGGVGFGAVGVEPGQVVVPRPGPARRAGGWRRPRPASHRSRPGRRPARPRPPRCSGRVTAGDHRDLLGGDQPVGERRGHRGQLLQRPPAPDQPRGRGGREPAVPAQPGLHRLQPVVLGGPHHLASCTVRASSASSRFRAASSTATRPAAPGRTGRAGHRRPALQRRHQLAHQPTPAARSHRSPVRILSARTADRSMNAQLRGLSTDQAERLARPAEP